MFTELSNTDKLREFVEELKRLKIDIIRPTLINVLQNLKLLKDKIYYGLGD